MSQVTIPSAFKDVFREDLRYIGYYGGRGSGKSHSVAQALVVMAAQKPLRILCCREIQLSIKDSVKRLLDDKIEAAGLSGFYDSTQTEIRGRNGSLFIFAGLRTNPDSIKSTEGIDIAWVEEANTVSDNSLKLLIPTVRKSGSRLVFTWNPRFDTDPVDSMLRGKEIPPKSVIKRVNWNDNPFFPDTLREEMEWDQRRDIDRYNHVWNGDYLKNSETRVFRNWSVQNFKTPEDCTFYFGADWGFSVDPTVLVRCWIDSDNRKMYIDREAYAVGCEIDDTPELFDKIPGAREWIITADSARPETISYMKRQGFRIRPAKKGADSVKDGIEFMKSYDIIVHPDCKHTIDELSHYSYKTDKLTGDITPILEDKKNHVIDACRYALEAVRRSGGFFA
ncbi:MAG: putative terminase large subunit [Prokaryotic dsDNA virus sp.]|nr:MAG: putative terminase large subunit [Prokaryotic dsDNA virus sp.]|tara:strand:- start:18958 stop:20136 length:1179 start_codon:yes stop_codon:yes gene_type:complete